MMYILYIQETPEQVQIDRKSHTMNKTHNLVFECNKSTIFIAQLVYLSQYIQINVAQPTKDALTLWLQRFLDS